MCRQAPWEETVLGGASKQPAADAIIVLGYALRRCAFTCKFSHVQTSEIVPHSLSFSLSLSLLLFLRNGSATEPLKARVDAGVHAWRQACTARLQSHECLPVLCKPTITSSHKLHVNLVLQGLAENVILSGAYPSRISG